MSESAQSEWQEAADGRTPPADPCHPRDPQRQYQRLFDHAINAVCICDLVLDDAGRPVDYIFTEANAAFERQTGLHLKDILGRRATEVYPGIERTGLIERYGRVALTGEAARFEIYFELTQKDYLVQAYQVESGRFAIVFEDITRQKELDALQHIQLTIASLLHAATAVDVLVQELARALAALPTVTGGGIYLFDEAAGEFRLDAHWGLPADFIALVSHVPMDSESGRRVMEGRPIFRNVVAGLPGSRQDSDLRSAGIRALGYFPLLYEGHAMGCMNLASTSVDEFSDLLVRTIQILGHQVALSISRLRAEARLRKSEEDYRTLADSALDGMAIITDEGRCLFSNLRAQTLLGYGPAELAALNLADVLHPAEQAAMEARTERQKAGLPVPPMFETVLIRKDGTDLPVEVSEVRTIWHGLECGLTVFRDVSARRRMEREIIEISEAERRRIGQDLHDRLGQQLTGLAYMIGSLASRLERREPEEAELARRVDEELRKAIVMTRQIAMDLSLAGSEGGGLLSALERMAANVSRTTGIRVQVTRSPERDVQEARLVHHLYHMATEAVTNAIRHGAAHRVDIRLAWAGEEGQLTVEDDGRGLEATVGKSPGMGLSVMSYRAHQIGATLAIGSAEPSGVRVVCRFREGLSAEGRMQADGKRGRHRESETVG